ncbi:MAG: chitobiase/beta-hexosaminidase C-terminal domain-containing protein [Bacteroidales bacterium]|nr:chitobiase/beta-hexosaminidase C-terminal domain-containing protein [Bacteroidales bacterium]
MTRKLTFLILALFALIAGPGRAEVVSGTTYETKSTSSLPNGWTGNGGGTSYIQLTSSSNHITTDNFIQNGFTSIVLKARKYGGPSDAQALITVSWYDAATSNETVLGTIAPTSTTLTDYTISSPTNPTGNTSGYIKIQCKGASSSKGSGVSEVTISYTAGSSTDPSITVNPTSIDLGTVNIGEEAEATFSVHQANLTSNISLSVNNGNLDITNILAGADDTEVSYTFTPNASGTISDVITISCDDLEENIEIAVSGNAIDPSQISYDIDFENEATAYPAWTFTNMTSKQTGSIEAHGGTNYGTTGGKTSASITTKAVVATPGILTCFVSKQTTNTTASTWAIQVSTDGSEWNDVTTTSATDMEKGKWKEFSANLNSYSNVYVRIYYSGSTAYRNIDDVTLTMASNVATPTFTPAAGIYDVAQNVSIVCATEGATIYYTTDGNEPTNASTLYEGAINVSTTTTIKAIAYVGNEASNVATAVYTIIPTYASLADLIAAGEPTTAGTPVNVTLTDETITGFYTSSGDYRNGIFLQVGDQEIEIYCHDVPEEWVIGGKVSGTLEDCTWKLYGDTWELCPDSWDDLTYLGPSFAIEIDDEMENGSIEIEDAQATATAGTEISFTVTPDEGYRMAAESLIVMDATGEEVEVSGNNPYTFTMPASDVTISAEFELLPTTTYQYLYSVNGVSGDELEAHEGESITLTTSEDLNDDFTFAGWTTDENDVENILAAGSSYIVNDEVIFYAVYAKEGQCIGEKTVILDGSTLSSTATTEETTHTIDGVSYKFSAGAKKQAIQTDAVNYFKDGDAVLIGKSGAHIYNDNPFGEGITKFEIYANKGASAKVSVGVYFSTIAITEYATGESTWTETLSTVDNVYDASGKLPDGAKYFWYQVTNANNSQIQFRITYKEQTATTKYYTRVYDENTTINDNLTVAGPSIILSGYTLTVTDTMSNTDPANLVIEDGAQLYYTNGENVNATFQKNITGYTGDNDNYYLIANPTDNDVVANLTSNEYDLYSFDPCGDEDGYEWINEEGEEVFVKPYSNEDGSAVAVGYLYANSEDVTLEFAGVLNPAGSTDIELTYAEEGTGRDFPGFNLIGNPYTCDAYVNGYNFYTMADGEFVINEGSATIAPSEGFFVEATPEDQSVTLSTTAPVTAPNALSLNVSQNRGNVIDRAIVNFNGSNNLHKFMMNPAHTNLSIVKGGETFAAISTEAEGELPVNFKAEKNGTYTITVNTKNVDAEYLHLIDNMTGMDVDLLSTPSYTFEAKTSDYASRFKLVFGVNNTASESSDSNFAFMSDGNLVIDNIEGEATLQIVDELGRIISTETVSGSYSKALNLKAGLYILNLNGMTQKIVVE